MRSLKENQKIILHNDAGTTEFWVNEVVGQGGSCVAYEVSYYEGGGVAHKGILKEYCPSFLERGNAALREEDGSLIISPDQQEAFESGLREFQKAYERINAYLFSNRSATNFHTAQLGLFEGLNTLYTLTALDDGKSLDKIEKQNVHTQMKIALAVTKAVEMYHGAGYLHLDIKPQNIFVMSNVSEIIKLFDFDSLTDMQKLRSGALVNIPLPGEYYVPELAQRNIRNIGVQTDIFEIGVLVFEGLFGRAPEPNEMNSDSSIDLDSCPLLQNVSPKAKYEIEWLLQNTLQISQYNRYESTAPLKQQLQKIIDLTQGNLPYLINMPKWEPSRFSLGRGAEVRALKQRLDADGYVFIKGMGGLGKSELSKQFAKQYAHEYHTVQFCKYTGSLKSVVAALPVNGVNDAEYDDFEKLVKYKNQILHQSDAHTLLIVDNFNVTYDEFLRDFLPAGIDGFKVIFTTRCEPAQEYYYDKLFYLDTLSDEACLQLFYLQARMAKNEQNDALLRNLIQVIHSNTLVLVLLAKAVGRAGLPLSDVIVRMEQSDMEEIDATVFHEYDFSSMEGENYNLVFAHLNTIFNMNGLTDVQKEMMLCLSLISDLGIGTDEFLADCQNALFTPEGIQALLSYGWVEQEQPGWIALHPVISDLIYANKSIQKTKSFDHLAYSIIEQCDAFGVEHIDTMHVMLSYLHHLDKRIGDEKEFRAIDAKTNLAKVYYYLYQPKEAMKKYDEAQAIAVLSFRFKPRLCRILQGKGEVEGDFGNPQTAITFYKEAVEYCKKTVNYYYDEHLLSLTGIAQCYVKLHDYKHAYQYYATAYEYIYHDSFKDKLNSVVFVTGGAGTKALEHYVPDLCDEMIAVCQELQWEQEAAKYKSIKNSFQPQEDPFQDVADQAKELLKRGNFKEGTRLFLEQLEMLKEQFGEDSPAFKKIMSDVMPLYVLSNAEDGAVSLHQVTESIEYIKTVYGEQSIEYLDFLEGVIVALLEAGQLDFAIELAFNGKANAKAIGLQSSYYYQSFNVLLIQMLQLKGRTDSLGEYIDEIDYSYFQSKSELEFLIKSAGMALYIAGYKKEAFGVAQSVYNLQNGDAPGRLVACILLAWDCIDSADIAQAYRFLQEGKEAIEFLDKTLIKDEYLYIYFITLAKCCFEQGELTRAVKTIDEYLDSIEDSRAFALTTLKCRALNEKSIYLRYLQNFEDAYEAIYQAFLIVQQNEIPELIQKAVYGNYAICSIHKELFEQGHEAIEKYMQMYNPAQKIADLDYLNCIIFYIDALLVKHDTSFYRLIEDAEHVVEQGHFENTFLNAMLENYIGVVLTDYEREYGLAENHFNTAKDLLEALGETNNPIYSQVISNIKYARDKIMNQLIGEMVQLYHPQEENEDE